MVAAERTYFPAQPATITPKSTSCILSISPQENERKYCWNIDSPIPMATHWMKHIAMIQPHTILIDRLVNLQQWKQC